MVPPKSRELQSVPSEEWQTVFWEAIPRNSARSWMRERWGGKPHISQLSAVGREWGPTGNSQRRYTTCLGESPDRQGSWNHDPTPVHTGWEHWGVSSQLFLPVCPGWRQENSVSGACRASGNGRKQSQGSARAAYRPRDSFCHCPLQRTGHSNDAKPGMQLWDLKGNLPARKIKSLQNN